MFTNFIGTILLIILVFTNSFEKKYNVKYCFQLEVSTQET